MGGRGRGKKRGKKWETATELVLAEGCWERKNQGGRDLLKEKG